jgi:hypothetical protein
MRDYENSLYSQGQAAESLAENSSDGEPSAPSNGNHTPLAFLPPDKMTAFSRLSRFGTTFAPLTENRGEDVLTWFLEASPVRTSHAPEKALELTVQDQDYGPRWQGSVARWNPSTSSWKTRQCSLFGGLESFLETWPDWGMMQDGEFWDMTTAEGNTKGKESGLLPTVTKEVFANWASAEAKINNGGKRKSGVKIGSIFWWTMTEMHLRLGGARESGMYPDPSCGEMLMGWVDSWTELTPLETDRFQRWCALHGKSSANPPPEKK